MKKFFYIIIFFLSVYVSSAQLPPFLAKDAVDFTKQYAKNDGGLVNPELLVVATASGEGEGLPGGMEISFNLADGKSNAWLYMFRERDTVTKMKYFGVIKNPVPIGAPFIAIQIPDSSAPELPETPQLSLESFNWINSDALVQALNANTTYSAYRAQNPNSIAAFLALGVNSEMPGFEENQPYWIVGIGKDAQEMPDLTCITHGVTAATVCIDNTVSAPFAEKPYLNAYPNPASSNFTVEIPEQSPVVRNVYLLDNSGAKLDISSSASISGGKLSINIAASAQGRYTIMLETEKYTYLVPMAVVK